MRRDAAAVRTIRREPPSYTAAPRGLRGRFFVIVDRLFGALAVLGGASFLVRAARQLARGDTRWIALSLVTLMGAALVTVGVGYLRASLVRQRPPAEAGEKRFRI